jgi:excisionase family DNA binding protein
MASQVASKKIIPPERLYLNALETSRIFGVDKSTVLRLAKRGKIPSRRFGGRVLIPKDFVFQAEDSQSQTNKTVSA